MAGLGDTIAEFSTKEAGQNRQFGDAPVLRYPDARFDERFYHLPNLTAGVAPFALGLPALMAGDRPTEGKE